MYADDMPQADVRERSTVTLVASLLVVLLLSGLAGAGGALLEHRRPSHWATQAVLIIDQEPALSTSHDSGIFEKLSRLRVKYSDLVRTTQFADRVSAKTGIDSARIHQELSTQVAAVSLLIAVSASDADASAAQSIAQGAAESLQEQLADEQARLSIPVQDRITLTIVSAAGPAVRVGPTRTRSLAVGAIVGLAVLGVGVVVVGALRRRST